MEIVKCMESLLNRQVNVVVYGSGALITGENHEAQRECILHTSRNDVKLSFVSEVLKELWKVHRDRLFGSLASVWHCNINFAGQSLLRTFRHKRSDQALN